MPPKTVIKLTVGSIKATVDGRPYTLDAAPFIKPEVNRTLVPVRFVAETLGARVD
ncbi:MAG: copper amine oxidase N-terminal domain-containing protein [Candidatus Desulforudis sp.]|nr:copper amine oxidase N-terminal domain-containing protein [Desulforudis sp.]